MVKENSEVDPAKEVAYYKEHVGEIRGKLSLIENYINSAKRQIPLTHDWLDIVEKFNWQKGDDWDKLGLIEAMQEIKTLSKLIKLDLEIATDFSTKLEKLTDWRLRK